MCPRPPDLLNKHVRVEGFHEHPPNEECYINGSQSRIKDSRKKRETLKN